MQNWKKINQVKVVFSEMQRVWFKGKYHEYKEVDFTSLYDAVCWLGWGTISNLKYGRLPLWYGLSLPFKLYEGDNFVIKDECGLIIPVWKIKETFNNLPKIHKSRKWNTFSWRKRNLNRTKYIKNERAAKSGS